MNEKAHALRPVYMDVKANEFKNYEAVTFPNGPAAGCDLYLRQVGVFPKPTEKTPYTVDVLDADGDIIDEINLTREAFRYLCRRLKVKRDRGDEQEAAPDVS